MNNYVTYPETEAKIIVNDLDNQIPVQLTIPINENMNIINENLISPSYIYVEKEEKYCGPISCLICIFTSILFLPAIIFIPLCPCDTRKKYMKYNN